MCGIYGMVGVTAPPSDATLERMANRLLHRGPDGNGQVVAGRAGMGCRRLAIIDVPLGGQPLANEAADVHVVCNGEIYNHARLRGDLAQRGHRFRTGSDAEVIPHLYEERGPDFVDAIDGMFAVAVWDARRQRLVLVRDRLGEKPLYYACTPDGLWFASEPKSLRAVGVGAEPEWTAIAHYLRTGAIRAPASAWAGIGELPRGGRLVLDGAHPRVDRYWELPPLLAAPPLALDLDAAARRLRAELERSVVAALTSDVPVGVFLSGGLDSTAVTALARPHLDQLSSFALGFDVPGFDERDHAALAAAALGTRHRTLTIDPALFLEGVRAIAPLIDEPLADPALVPTFLLSRFARREVKVVLVGEGADELFAGYPTYLGGALAERFRRLPAAWRRSLLAAAPLLGASQGNTTARWMARRFLEEADRPIAERHREWTGCIAAAQLTRLATPGGPLAPAGHPLGWLTPAIEPPGRSTVDQLLSLDLTGYLPDVLLRKVDRATMAASLEGRAPFLDHHLVEFACRLPVALKLRGPVTKRVLRRAVADVVPAAIRRRIKRGLSVPLAAWLAGPLLPFARDMLARLDPAVIQPGAVRQLLDEHVARRRDNRRELWALVMLQLWMEHSAA
jgi:asparagine synthase (glutamine-hydrolysing)